jgi:hypothetical protein
MDSQDVQVVDDDEEIPGADELLAAMAQQREAARAADREARARMEGACVRGRVGVVRALRCICPLSADTGPGPGPGGVRPGLLLVLGRAGAAPGHGG